MNTMMNNFFAQMQQMMQNPQMQQQAFGVTPEKQSNPFWYRENAGYLTGVTNGPSNPMFGIEGITLNPRSGNQPATLLANGRMATMIGHVSFQIFTSSKGAPYVSVNSTKNEKNNTYYEHVLLKPQVKAQILRYYEAWACSGGMQQMAQQPMQNNFGFGMQMPQMQMPQQQMQAPQPQQVQQPDMMQMMMAMQQMQQQMAQMQQVPTGTQQQEAPPAPAPESTQQTEAVDEGVVATEDDMPI